MNNPNKNTKKKKVQKSTFSKDKELEKRRKQQIKRGDDSELTEDNPTDGTRSWKTSRSLDDE